MEESLLKKEADKKHNSWALYRECTRLMEENHTRWLERRTAEEKRRLEDEKAAQFPAKSVSKSGVRKSPHSQCWTDNHAPSALRPKAGSNNKPKSDKPAQKAAQ